MWKDVAGRDGGKEGGSRCERGRRWHGQVRGVGRCGIPHADCQLA